MNELTTRENDVSAVVTEKLLMDYLKAKCNGLNNSQIEQFVAVSLAFKLNPWKREVYPVTFKDKNGNINLSIVTGYEVYVKRADMNPYYDGFETVWKGDFKYKTFKNKYGYDTTILAPEGVVSCTCIVYRKDRKCPTKCEVFFDEYDQKNNMWQTKPRVMLEKVAIARALRLAFPNDFGGMPYASEELPENMSTPLLPENKKPDNVIETTTANDQNTKLPEHSEKSQPAETEKVEERENPAEPVNAEDAKEAQVKLVFLKMMNDLCLKNPELYKEILGRKGYEAAADVPKANRQKVYKAINKEISELNKEKK